MNRHLKLLTITSFLVLFVLSSVCSFSFVKSALAEDIDFSWQNKEKTVVTDIGSFLPVREVMETFGFKLGWSGEEVAPKIIIKNGTNEYQVLIISEDKVRVGNKDFYYKVSEGNISLPVSFYEYVLNNANVTLTESKALHVSLINPKYGITLKNLPTYVKEPKTVKQTMDQSSVQQARQEEVSYYQSGQATWYGAALQGNYTASGERFNMYDLMAAHKTLPFGTRVKVTNLNNGKAVVVRITDRGPFAPGRVIDLSMAAAEKIDMISSGVVPVKLEIIQ